MPYLEVTRKNDRLVQRVELGETLTIGRSSANRLPLSDISVSRRHCIIETVDGTTCIRDLGSRHGLWINRKRVAASELGDGDRIRIGPYELTFFAKEREGALSAGASSSDQVEQLTSNCRKAEADLAATVEQVEHAAAMAQSAQERFDEASGRVAALEAELGEARAALTATRDEAARVRQDRESLEGRLTEVEQEREVTLATVAQLEAHLGEARELRGLAEDTAATAQADRHRLAREIEAVEQHRAAAVDEVARLHGQLVEAHEKLATLAACLKESRSLLIAYQQLLAGAETVEAEEVELVQVPSHPA